MAYQVKQVFYINDPSKIGWLVVLQGKSMCNASEENQESTFNISKTPFSYALDEESEVGDVHATCDDHEKWIILENTTTLP